MVQPNPLSAAGTVSPVGDASLPGSGSTMEAESASVSGSAHDTTSASLSRHPSNSDSATSALPSTPTADHESDLQSTRASDQEDAAAASPQVRDEKRVKYTHAFDKLSSHALITIRFPAIYEQAALPHLNTLPGLMHVTESGIGQLVNEQVIKSSYFAVELYNYLRERLPKDSVILVPSKLTFKDGKVSAEPLSKSVPTVLTVEMVTHVDPERIKASSKQGAGVFSADDTYGNKLKLFCNVYRTGTDGKEHLIAGSPLFNKHANKYGLSVADYYNAKCAGQSLKTVNMIHDRSVVSKLPVQDSDFFDLPTQSSCPGSMFKLHVSNTDKAHPLFEKLWGTYSDVLISYLNLDAPKWDDSMLSHSVADLDPGLPALLEHTDKDSHHSDSRVRFAKQYLLKERTELYAPLSAKTCETIYNGEFGDSVRALLKSELDYERKYSASQKRKIAAGVFSFAATAGSIATSLAVPTYGVQGLLSTLAVASAAIATNETKLQTELTKCFHDYDHHATGVQRKFMLKFGDEVVEVAGDSVDELRTKVRERYHTIFLSHPHTAHSTPAKPL